MNNKQQLLSSLDVFLLALVDSGVATVYSMREQAGISVGASRPALQRLKKLGFVEEGEVEARNKLKFRLTRRGRHAIVAGLSHLLEEFRVTPPSDTESILRIASLAASAGEKLAAARLLKEAAEECKRRAREFEETAPDTTSGVAGAYQSMMASCSAAHFQAVSRALSDLAVDLKKSPTNRSILQSRPKDQSKS
jgi:DNA-binding PadR family transcriptional regulator